MKKVKKVLNIEYDLTSDEFIDQKLDSVCEKYQTIYPDLLCKVTTFCVADGHFVNGTTQSNVDFMGAPSKMLGSNPMANSSMITLDDDMVRTYEFTITADTDLPDYVTALNVAQANADKMFATDSSKIPLITVIDYRWGNGEFTVGASIFSTTDEDGNKISLIGATDSAANVVVGDANLGEFHTKVLSELKDQGSFKLDYDDRDAPFEENICMMEFDLILDGDNDKDWDNKIFGDKDSNESYVLISGIKTYWKDEEVIIETKQSDTDETYSRHYSFGDGSFNNFNHKIKIFNLDGKGYLYVDDVFTYMFDTEFDFSIPWYFGSENDDRNIDDVQINNLIYGIAK